MPRGASHAPDAGARRERRYHPGRWSACWLLGVAISAASCPASEAFGLLEWPTATPTAKPWAYWYWMGSAVDEANLTRELERCRDAGLGGVHVIPIYGVKGWESRFVPHLSPRWAELLRHAAAESRRLGLGLDMTMGTGWNFGGPRVPVEESCLRVDVRCYDADSADTLPARLERRGLLAVLATESDGRVTDLTGCVAEDGRMDWSDASAGVAIRVVSLGSGYLPVERAAPGGEGLMINPFFGPAVANHLRGFEEFFAAYDGIRPRGLYHDSFEYHGAAWSPDVTDEFRRRRGYRLEDHRAALFRAEPDESDRRVRSDFRETLSELLQERFADAWASWASARGFVTRNQAHGAPGNLLDLYAAADIPETEVFHADRDVLMSKFASSAAHVAGRRLVSAETGTWIADHFTERLADLKRLADELFVAGVNHVFYHGMAYSPDEAQWPGWLFYAATQMNPRNPIWRDVPALNAYIARCQAVLQAGEADNDVLLYWPIHDLWFQQQGLIEELTVHRRGWFEDQPLGWLARRLWERGFCFDYVSDRQLAAAAEAGGRITLPGGAYAAVVVPRCRTMPLATLRTLFGLAESGATVVFEGELPCDVPGWGDLEARRGELVRLGSRLAFAAAADTEVRQARTGKGRVLVGDVEAALRVADVRRETLVDQPGLVFIRRRSAEGRSYFVVNGSERSFTGWLPLAAGAAGVGVLDPMSGKTGVGESRTRGDRTEVRLQLAPAESLVVRTSSRTALGGPAWECREAAGAPTELGGRWQVEFVAGGPDLPPPFATDRLGSWTTQGGAAAAAFGGTARYTLRFDAPFSGGRARLDLGRVHETARVRLNGRDLGTVLLPPYQVLVDELRPRDNVLEVEVTNLAANRIRDLDRRGVDWKRFYDVNFVGIDYRPFDASAWPIRDSGLLGPVTAQPLR